MSKNSGVKFGSAAHRVLRQLENPQVWGGEGYPTSTVCGLTGDCNKCSQNPNGLFAFFYDFSLFIHARSLDSNSQEMSLFH